MMEFEIVIRHLKVRYVDLKSLLPGWNFEVNTIKFLILFSI